MRSIAAALAASCCCPRVLPPRRLTPAQPSRIDVDVDTPRLQQIRSAAGIEPCVQGSAEPVEGGLPQLSLPCLGGGDDVDLSTLDGPLVVNFWAQNCAPCRTEMPILQEFHEDRRGDVGVIGIDWQDVQPEAALELARATGVTYPLLADPGDETSGAGPINRVRGLPMLLLVDAGGRVVHQEFVALRSRAQLDRLVAEHLGSAA